MVELVMVMILVGILSALVIPRLGNIASYSLSSAAQGLVEAVRYTQQQSMANSGANPYQIQISGTGFTVTQSGVAITNPLTGASGYTEDSAVWSGVSVTSASGTISFDARGLPSCSAGLPACSLPSDSNITITLAKGGDSKSITLERYTGYARPN